MNRPSHKELLPMINKVKEKVKQSNVYKDMCNEYGVDLSYIDLVPMAFDDIDVSARTNRGCIYFNYALIDDGEFENEDHYMIHELTHHFQQCFGDGPTKGSTEDNYLDNKHEQEGFQAQTEYLSETRDDDTAERYVEKVLDHHEVPDKERKKRKEDLLNLAIEMHNKKKEAGLFKIPKAWADRLEKKVIGIYASLVWERANNLIEQKKQKEEAIRAYHMSEEGKGPLADFYNELARSSSKWYELLKELKAGDNYSYKFIESPAFVLALGIEKLFLSIAREDEDLYEIEISFPNDEMANKVKEYTEKYNFLVKPGPFSDSIMFNGDANTAASFLEIVSSNILNDTYVPEIQDLASKEGEINYVDIYMLIKECKKFTSAPLGKEVKGIELLLDLNEVIHDLSAVSEYLQGIDINRYGPLIYKGLRYRNWPESVPIKAFFGSRVEYTRDGKNRTAMGLYSPSTHTISISFSTVLSDSHFTDTFLDSVDEARQTIRHELQHMLQDMLKDIKSLTEPAGIPSKKVRNLEYSHYGTPKTNKGEELEHGLIDIEFYTDLTDAVQIFNNATSTWPENLKIEYAKRFVGEPDNLDDIVFNKVMSPEEIEKLSPRDITRTKEFLTWKYKTHEFFKALRQGAPGKWKIAVREFMKAIQ